MEIRYWENYVKDFILEQDKPIQGKLITKISDFESYPSVEAFKRDPNVVKLTLPSIDLYEIKLRCNKAYYRFLFVLRSNIAYLLEGFKKKSNETPQRYINTAIQRSRTLDYQLTNINSQNI